MHYDADTGTVIYRSKMHLGLKRNFQVLPAPAQPEPVSEFARRAKAAWARLIGKVYEADTRDRPDQ